MIDIPASENYSLLDLEQTIQIIEQQYIDKSIFFFISWYETSSTMTVNNSLLANFIFNDPRIIWNLYKEAIVSSNWMEDTQYSTNDVHFMRFRKTVSNN
ncbi:MAG: hypothetical protein ACXADY_19410, partial [Candidatus Hodarchaeales archaeon]|jgi:hypothetical protein